MQPCLRLIVAAVLFCWPVAALADGAVFADERLWIIQDKQIYSLAKGEASGRTEALGGPVISLCQATGRLTALTEAPGQTGTLVVYQRGEGHWGKAATLAGAGPELVAMLCVENSVLVVTKRKLITVEKGGTRQIALHGKFSYGQQTLLGTRNDIFIGYGRGEWGGGLQAIRREDGRIRSIGKNESGDLCGGPLNADCDPVLGIAVPPWKPECVAVAVGLLHLGIHGRIVTICGDAIQTLYARQFGERFANLAIPESEAYDTIPFYDVIGDGDDLLALGMDGLYRISPDGKATILPIPEFESIDGYRISFEIPGVVLIAGDRERDDAYFSDEIQMIPR
ncbi:hypothetical protein [Asticcacaulis sp. AC402]|uniref:hypothetical protein n=1 Tax=Asticcacaulis sp. AC402 TaxID=1282361 RepID=UPI00041E9942|nr:hypothetical protein [Asticcacaulis sp. AC402]